MDASVILPAITAVLAGFFSLALIDQWRTRRRGYQLVWAIGMAFFAIAVAVEAIAASSGWNETLYRIWYLTGAVWTAGWLGLGTAFLLGRTRFGFGFAVCLFFAGLFTFLTARANPVVYEGAGTTAMLYFLIALVLALAVSVETAAPVALAVRVELAASVALAELGDLVVPEAPAGLAVSVELAVPASPPGQPVQTVSLAVEGDG